MTHKEMKRALFKKSPYLAFLYYVGFLGRIFNKHAMYKLKLWIFYKLWNVKPEWLSDLKHTLKYFDEVWERETFD